MASDFQIIDDTPDEPLPDPVKEDRLNLARIRAIALDRRAAHRRRFWARAIVVIFASGAAMTAIDAFRVSGARRLGFILGSIAFAVLALRAALRVQKLSPHPSAEISLRPDDDALHQLSDGSHFARNLDELNRPGP